MQLSISGVKNVFTGKTVTIVAQAPHILSVDTKWIDDCDYVVRLNNFCYFNDYDRMDVYYSFFGRSIFKTFKDLKECSYIICKYPDHYSTTHNPGYEINFSMVYKRPCWQTISKSDIPYYIPSLDQFYKNRDLIGRVPTTGVSCILDMLRYGAEVRIAGFDLFESGTHDITRKWNKTGNHNLSDEKELLKKLKKDKKILVDPIMETRL